MNIKETLWKLSQLAECSILDKNNREAARQAAEALTSIMHATDIKASQEFSDLSLEVYRIANNERDRFISQLTRK